MKNLPLQSQHLLGPVIVLLLAFALAGLEPQSGVWMAFQRSDIEAGQWWRLLTANLLHTNVNHLLLNAGGVLLLWALHGDYYQTKGYLGQVVFLSLGCCLGLLFFSPDTQHYVGLSGVLHGLFLWGAYQDIRHRVAFGKALFIGVWVKVLYEQFSQPNTELAEFIGASVAVDAHLYGTISGLIMIVLCWIWQRNK